jgi:hypothetical protein
LCGFARPIELQACVCDFHDERRDERMGVIIAEMTAGDRDVWLRLRLITDRQRHSHTDIISVRENPSERFFHSPNRQRMVGALRRHFQDLTVKELDTSARRERPAIHQLIIFRATPSFRPDAHANPPNPV